MTYAIHNYKTLESFNHLNEFENWIATDDDVDTFRLSTDTIQSRYSAFYEHGDNTNDGIVYREFNGITLDLETNYTYLFIWVKSFSNTITHSGSEGFGLSHDNGSTVDYWYLDTDTADVWKMIKGTLSTPDDDNGIDMSAVNRILYTNNNANSDVYLGFSCVAEPVYTFDTGNFISKPVNVKVGHNFKKQKVPFGDNVIELLGKLPRAFSIRLLLNGTSAWTDLNSLADLAKQNKPYLFEADWWFKPVVITNFSLVDKSRTQTANQDCRNEYEVTIDFKEFCGD